MHGQSFSCVGLRFRVWATVSMHGPSFSCVGNRFRVWVTVLVRGRPSLSVVVVSVCGRSFPCMGGRLDAEVALVGSLLRVGSLSCGSAGTIVEGWVVLTMLKNNDEQRIFIRHSLFGCHVTDSDVVLCSVCFACVLRLSWLCGARIGGHGVWRWMVRAGAGGRCVWMMVVTWKGCGIRIWTEFPLAEIADILSRKEVTRLVLRA